MVGVAPMKWTGAVVGVAEAAEPELWYHQLRQRLRRHHRPSALDPDTPGARLPGQAGFRRRFEPARATWRPRATIVHRVPGQRNILVHSQRVSSGEGNRLTTGRRGVLYVDQTFLDHNFSRVAIVLHLDEEGRTAHRDQSRRRVNAVVVRLSA